jgi:hypothetical protein
MRATRKIDQLRQAQNLTPKALTERSSLLRDARRLRDTVREIKPDFTDQPLTESA